MARRKTVEIRTLVEKVNRQNANSVCSKDIREGWNCFLEDILMDASVYAGYSAK
jgi:hypothetical protein